jgi:TRIAD3 protein (E3 ubiquitin-protein ligase RNF216)
LFKVKEAAERALEKYKEEHPDVDEAAIKVDLPAAAAVPQAAPGLQYPVVPLMGGINPFHHVAPMVQLQLGGNPVEYGGFPIPAWMHQQQQQQAEQDPVAAGVRAQIHAARAGMRLEREAARMAEHARQLQQLAARAQRGADQVLNAYHVHHQPRVDYGQPEPVVRRNPVRNQPPPDIRRPVTRNHRRQ